MEEEYRANLEHFALERLGERLDSNITLIDAALNDINQMKYKAAYVKFAGRVENAMQLILDMNGQRPHSLFEMISYSLLNPSSPFWQDVDKRVSTLREKRNVQDMLILRLYKSIKGYYSYRLFYAYLQAPKLRSSPIKHFVYMLKIYNQEITGSYSVVDIVVTWLKFIGSIIEWFDQVDENPKERHWAESIVPFESELEYHCQRHPSLFNDFWSQYIEPFLTEMKQFKDIYYSIMENQGHSYYLINHRDQHVDRVKTFLLQIATLLKQIYMSPDESRQRMLCQDIAFAIECTVGKHDPINQLYDSLTPFMTPYYLDWT